MVHGKQWATSTEISVATRFLQSNMNNWLQGRDGHNNICFTKEEYINSSLSRNVDLLLHLNHFKLLIKNYSEQNGFQFHSTIQQKSNKDSFSKLNKIYKNKISKGKQNEKRKQPQEKSSTSGKKIKLAKSNTNVEHKNLNLNLIFIIVKYFSL